jgi:hypothetical protein
LRVLNERDWDLLMGKFVEGALERGVKCVTVKTYEKGWRGRLLKRRSRRSHVRIQTGGTRVPGRVNGRPWRRDERTHLSQRVRVTSNWEVDDRVKIRPGLRKTKVVGGGYELGFMLDEWIKRTRDPSRW